MDSTSLPLDLGAPAAELLAHVLMLSLAVADAAATVDGPTTRTAPTSAEPQLPEGWREQLPERVDRLAEFWRDPAAWTGTAVAGGIEMPAEVANHELVLHGWDLAGAGRDPHWHS